MTLRIEWRHLRGERSIDVQYMVRETKAACLDDWAAQVAVYRRTIYPATFTCVCSFV